MAERQPNSSVYYNYKGQEDAEFNAQTACAKKTRLDSKRSAFYVKYSSSKRKLFDPREDRINQKRSIGTTEFKLKLVSEQAFNTYLTYLQKGTPSLYRLAQRKVMS